MPIKSDPSCFENQPPILTPNALAYPIDSWHEGEGPVLWWFFPVTEAPYVGTPLDDDFPEGVTHWTKLDVPEGGM